MPEIVTAQRNQEWHDARKGRITASLAAACLRIGPKSAASAWRQIVLGEKENVNRYMQYGIQFEAAARLDCELEFGFDIQTTGFWVHPMLDWLGASPDGLVGNDGLVEIKCPNECPAGVPVHHRIQMLVQLAVTERQWCLYYSWGASGKRFSSVVYRAGIPNLICMLDRFRRKHILTGIEPGRKKPQRRRKKLVAHCDLSHPIPFSVSLETIP